MALIGKIRQRTGLLIGVIGLALLAFLLMDALSSSSMMGGSKQSVGKMGGKSVSIQEFQQEYTNYERRIRSIYGQQSIDEQTSSYIREEVWNNLAMKSLMSENFDDLGLNVSEKEIAFLFVGPNPHPVVKQLFVNPETGKFDPNMVRQVYNQKEESEQSEQTNQQLSMIERQVKEDRLKTKYGNLIAKGMYVPTFVAKDMYAATNRSGDISYVVWPLSEVPDGEVSVSDKELQNYLNAHREEYKQEASSSIEYVKYDIVPSKEDTLAMTKFFDETVEEFRNAENDSIFIRRNSDVAFSKDYYTADQITPLGILHGDQLFEAEAGSIVGPFLENGSYVATKVLDKKMIPDSIKARHILFEYKTIQARDSVFALADSLIELLDQKKVKFEDLAVLHSTDLSNKDKGGDLGYFTQGKMVKPFNDILFFTSTQGDIVKVETRFGLHIIENVASKPSVEAVRIARLSKELKPSSDTEKDIYRQAGQFEKENNSPDKFKEATANTEVLKINTIGQNDVTLAGLGSAREVVKWAFNGDIGDIKFFNLDDKFIVAHLTGKREKGYATVEDRRIELESKVRNEKKKVLLSEKAAGFMTNATNLQEVASSSGGEVKSALGLIYSNPSVTGIGYEPKVVAAAFGTATGKLKGPIAGETGVYVIQVDNMSDLGSPGNYAQQQQQLKTTFLTTTNFGAILNDLKERADIKDNRYTFY